jgi:hypothetical protein
MPTDLLIVLIATLAGTTLSMIVRRARRRPRRFIDPGREED